jgi:hypothetical protein
MSLWGTCFKHLILPFENKLGMIVLSIITREFVNSLIITGQDMTGYGLIYYTMEKSSWRLKLIDPKTVHK